MYIFNFRLSGLTVLALKLRYCLSEGHEHYIKDTEDSGLHYYTVAYKCRCRFEIHCQTLKCTTAVLKATTVTFSM